MMRRKLSNRRKIKVLKREIYVRKSRKFLVVIRQVSLKLLKISFSRKRVIQAKMKPEVRESSPMRSI